MYVNFQLYRGTFDMMNDNTTVEIEEETSLPGPRPRLINHSTDNHEKNEERSTSLQHTHHIEKQAENICKLYFSETVIVKKRKEVKTKVLSGHKKSFVVDMRKNSDLLSMYHVI